MGAWPRISKTLHGSRLFFSERVRLSKVDSYFVTSLSVSSNFQSLGLSPTLLQAVAREGYVEPTPIQTRAIPHVLEGRDLLGIAQTGTGKTAAFLLPILQGLSARPSTGKIRALVLSPTRELAAQIGECAAVYGDGSRVRHMVMFGGVGQSKQEDALRRGVDLLVATPGRLLDLMQQGFVRLDAVEYFVLDEADRMLDMGFVHDVRRVVAVLPKKRQTLLFSATVPGAIRELAQTILHDPIQVSCTPEAPTAERIEQGLYFVSKAEKKGLLARVVGADHGRRAIVFTRTKHGANRVCTDLERVGVHAAAIHGNKSQNARERALDGFRAGSVHVLVATDIAACGIDVDGVSLVVNFDLPNIPESYVHRIGRTGRAGRSGRAILFVTPRQVRMKRDIEQYTKQQIEPMKLPTKADIAARRISSLKEKIVSVLTDQELELYLSLVEDIAEEHGCDISEIAAAAMYLSVGDKPLEVVPEPVEFSRNSFPESGMVKLYFNLGRRHRISPSDIVGAIANEGNIPGKAIGAIDVNDRFSLVDVPKQFVSQILSNMKNTQIRSQLANIRLASDANPEFDAKPRDFRENRDAGFDRGSRPEKPHKKKNRARFLAADPRSRKPPKRKAKK